MYTNNLLRQSRLDNKVSLDQIVARTKLPLATVELIDQGRLRDLPRGLYGRAYVRSFAAAVGLDPGEALAWCSDQLVDVPDPLPALREIVRERTAPTLAALIADRVREWSAGREARTVTVPRGLYPAAAVDALVLVTVNMVLVAVIARACGVNPDFLIRQAGWVVIPISAFTSIAYFVLLAGVGGQTPGMRCCAVPARPRRGPLDLRAIGARAAEAALGEASILIDWLCTSEVPKTRESTV